MLFNSIQAPLSIPPSSRLHYPHTSPISQLCHGQLARVSTWQERGQLTPASNSGGMPICHVLQVGMLEAAAQVASVILRSADTTDVM